MAIAKNINMGLLELENRQITTNPRAPNIIEIILAFLNVIQFLTK